MRVGTRDAPPPPPLPPALTATVHTHSMSRPARPGPRPMSRPRPTSRPTPPRSPLCESGDTQVTPRPATATVPGPVPAGDYSSSLRPSTPSAKMLSPRLLEPSPFFASPLLPSHLLPGDSLPFSLLSFLVVGLPVYRPPGAWSQSEARSKYDLCFPISNIPSQVQSSQVQSYFFMRILPVRSHDFLPSRFMDVYLRAIRHLFASRTPFDFIPSLCHLQPNARYVWHAGRWDEFVMDPDIILADDVTRRVTRGSGSFVTSPETFAAKMVDM
ncbi:hypothetical protein PAPYR_9116 [Paratrimastix pyriformis]|uniref:Uncharacterized protein n=1 Tax=Paratrimastix pyriformis TaxID=342808 RepID=A0ABQ8UDU8_9EUKA|nr:hypothetical protein PAPYR_9116 [Paratrimastix pyriformis]